MTMVRVVGVALCGALLAACMNDGGTIYKKDQFGPYNILSVDARQRLVIQGAKLDDSGVERTVICTEPSPDAISAQAANLAASANATLPNNVQGGAQLAAGYSEAVASIAMRTQSIQVLRDGYFRLCEAYLNGAIDKDQYRRVMFFIDEFIATVVAIEALGGTVTVPPAAIVASQGVSVLKDGAIEVKPEAAKLTIEYKAPEASIANAAAIENILKKYYERKAQFHKLVLNSTAD